MSQNASSHTITVCGVQFKILAIAIAQPLGLTCIFEAVTTVDVEVEDTHNVGTYASSTRPVDFVAH